jgi:branched-chain amino acid transport system ATP-binding protein
MLEIKDVVVGYLQDLPILNGVSVSAPTDRITCIIGPNGAGKSTLLKAIFGLLKPTAGSITFAGDDLMKKSPDQILKTGISLLPQAGGIFPFMSVEQNLKVGAWTIRSDKKRISEGIEKIWERYPFLKKKRRDRASTLSGGEQRILDLAKTLIIDPKMILADEPTAGLSVKFYDQVYSELQALRDNDHRGVLLVDQNVRGAIGICDYAYVLEAGQNSIQGSKADFQEGSLKEMAKNWLAFE